MTWYLHASKDLTGEGNYPEINMYYEVEVSNISLGELVETVHDAGVKYEDIAKAMGTSRDRMKRGIRDRSEPTKQQKTRDKYFEGIVGLGKVNIKEEYALAEFINKCMSWVGGEFNTGFKEHVFEEFSTKDFTLKSATGEIDGITLDFKGRQTKRYKQTIL